MFQTTRRRLAIWYTTVTAILLLLLVGGVYWYVRSTLIERVDDTLNHVVEVVQRSLVIEPVHFHSEGGLLAVNVEASFRNNAQTVEDDHIDLEWFGAHGELLWSTLSEPLDIPLHANPNGETVYLTDQHLLRQVTQLVQIGDQVLGYLRVSHPWFEVTKPSRAFLVDLCLGTGLMVVCVAAIGWFLSGLAIAPIRDSYQRLKQFTADASHELRNPIAIIQTNAQVALADPEPDPQLQRQQLEVVERLTRRLGRLVDDLLFLARQDSSMVQPRWATISLDSLLADVLEEQQTVAAEKAISLNLTIDPPITASQADENPDLKVLANNPFLLPADRDQLARLFTNLIGNAIQYTPTQGQIDVELRLVKRGSSAAQLQVKVRDTGMGIPAEALTQIFDRFYRVDPARSRSQAAFAHTSGSGLGLAIAQAIVENHQGQIRVESTLHQGTTVTVTLPQHVHDAFLVRKPADT
jgi:OmpR-family two-component system manganese-sensing sensor histidine kinase